MESIKSVVSDGKNAAELEQTIEGVAIERAKIDNLNAGCIHAGTIKLNSEGKPIFASGINFDEYENLPDENKNILLWEEATVNEIEALKQRICQLETLISNINLNRKEVL